MEQRAAQPGDCKQHIRFLVKQTLGMVKYTIGTTTEIHPQRDSNPLQIYQHLHVGGWHAT